MGRLGGGSRGGAPTHAKTMSPHMAITPAANDSAFEGDAVATNTTAPTSGATPTRSAAPTKGGPLKYVLIIDRRLVKSGDHTIIQSYDHSVNFRSW